MKRRTAAAALACGVLAIIRDYSTTTVQGAIFLAAAFIIVGLARGDDE